MNYSTTKTADAGNSLSGAEDWPAEGQSKASGGAEKNLIHLSPNMLPQGATAKSGDRLTFVVSGEPDTAGDIPGYFESSDSTESEDDKWAEEMRSDMSPMMKQQENS